MKKKFEKYKKEFDIFSEKINQLLSKYTDHEIDIKNLKSYRRSTDYKHFGQKFKGFRDMPESKQMFFNSFDDYLIEIENLNIQIERLYHDSLSLNSEDNLDVHKTQLINIDKKSELFLGSTFPIIKIIGFWFLIGAFGFFYFASESYNALFTLIAPIAIASIGTCISWILWKSKAKSRLNINRRILFKKTNSKIEELVPIIFAKMNSIISEIEKETSEEKLRAKKLISETKKILNRIDKNDNGQVDGLEHNGYDLFLNENEKNISKIKKEYLNNFVMISNHLIEYKNNIQSIFETVSNSKNEEELNEYVESLENNIEAWQLLQVNGIYMIDSLVNENDIQFFKLYQSFEKLGIFDSTWQKKISDQLNEVNSNIRELIDVTNSMSSAIVSSIGDLTYATEKQTNLIDQKISSLDSSVKFGNLLSAINIYQNHRINKKLN